MKNALVVLVCAASLAGCGMMRGGGESSGAGRGAGYGGERTTGQVVDDATITTQVKAALAADPDLSAMKINVDTDKGAVRLKGEVKSIALRRKADSVAARVKGVRSVDNQLVVTG
jgi:osmotically-inducible protein OsmY